MRTGKLIAVCLLMLVSSALLMTAGLAGTATTGQGPTGPAAAQAAPTPDTGDATLGTDGVIGDLGGDVYAATPDGVRGQSPLPNAMLYLALALAAIDLAVALFVLVFGTRPWIVIAMTVVVTFSVIQLGGTLLARADDLHKISSAVAFVVSLLCFVMMRAAERDRPRRRKLATVEVPAMQFHQRRPREVAPPPARAAAPVPGHATRMRALGTMGPDGVGGHLDVPGGSYVVRVEGASPNVELAVCDDGGHWLSLPRPDAASGKVQVHLTSGRFYLVARDAACQGSMVSVAVWDVAPAAAPSTVPVPAMQQQAVAAPAPQPQALVPASAMAPVAAPCQPAIAYPQPMAYPQPVAYQQPQQPVMQPQQPQVTMEQWQAGMGGGMAGQLQPAFRPQS